MKEKIPHHDFIKLALSIFCAAYLAACGSAKKPQATVFPSHTIEPTGTNTLKPIATNTLQPTHTPTSTPSRTVSPSPTPTFANPFLTPEVFPTLALGQAITLTKLHMVNEVIGWGMDDAEHILRTTDGGKTWRDVSPPEDNFDLGFALDEDHAWAVPIWKLRVDEKGYIQGTSTTHIWRTSDGGLSWQVSEQFSLERYFNKSSPYKVSSFIAKIQFIDDQIGWLLMDVDVESYMTYGWQLFNTKDGGMTWMRIIDSEQGGPPILFSIVFSDGDTGWSAGSDVGRTGVYKNWNLTIGMTPDGGQNWITVPIPEPDHLPEAFDHYEMDCGSRDIFLISGESFGVLSICEIFDNKNFPHYSFYSLTQDGGKTFYTWPLNNYFPGSVDFINNHTGWQIVESPDGGYTLEHTEDSGQTWKTLQPLTWYGSLDFVNENIGWAIAFNGDIKSLFFTQDGGNTWFEMKPIVTK
jgi:photosystem II stability/assembly factor-like uncharacterized protein